MKFEELKTKEDKELAVILAKAKEDLQTMNFKIFSRQLKNIREVRENKKLITAAAKCISNFVAAGIGDVGVYLNISFYN